MGIYYGSYANSCVRCGTGVVGTVFISVTPMSFHARCSNCGAEDFTAEEREIMDTTAEEKPRSRIGQRLTWGFQPVTIGARRRRQERQRRKKRKR